MCGSGLSNPPREEDRAAEGEDHGVNGGLFAESDGAAWRSDVLGHRVSRGAVPEQGGTAEGAARVSVNQAVAVVPQIAEPCWTMARRGSRYRTAEEARLEATAHEAVGGDDQQELRLHPRQDAECGQDDR